jgi:putative restriction endonuclease
VARHPAWTRNQLLIVLRLYCNEPFGRLHRGNPTIVDTATLVGRTPSAVVFKACNFASLDPTHRQRGVKGLKNTASADRELWAEFLADSERIAAEAEAAYERLAGTPSDPVPGEPPSPLPGPTERDALVRVRRVQGFFRRAVLASYENRCAISGIPIGELLNASHIIPWSVDPLRRADPRNGIALNALYDRAFDRGLISIDAKHRVLVSPRLRVPDPTALHRTTLLALEGHPVHPPTRFLPSPEALAYHRDTIFIQ